MAKINLDKYYTPANLAEYCVNKTKEIIGVENITHWIEPAAGAGAFLPFLGENFNAYDIEPEGEKIEKNDYLKLRIHYKPGRCIIGNPPFGKFNNLSIKFYKKAIREGDYISFILPISQYNNNMQMFEFDLIYSENLGLNKYSDINVHCALNIYKRNKYGLKKSNLKKYELKCISIIRINRNTNKKPPKKYDFSICGFGTNIGKLATKNDEFCNQKYIIINDLLNKDLIKKTILEAKWSYIYKMTAAPALHIWQINKYLKEKIPFLE